MNNTEGRTVRHIARVIRRPPADAERLLAELAEAGIAKSGPAGGSRRKRSAATGRRSEHSEADLTGRTRRRD
jgi:DNA-binding IclR family transcriptional regulator